MRLSLIILTIISFAARYSADYGSCHGSVNSFTHAQQCYQLFSTEPSDAIDQPTAKQRCKDAKGNLAVVVSDFLREKLAQLAQAVAPEVLVALVQQPGSWPTNGAGDNWFWDVEGRVNLAAKQGKNSIEWNSGEPDDEEANQDRGLQQFAVLVTANAKFKDSAGPFSNYLCQFRKKSATLRLFAHGASMTVGDKEGGFVFGGSLEECAIACHANPSCMAFSYMTSTCHFQLERPQEAPGSIASYAGVQLWYKE